MVDGMFCSLQLFQQPRNQVPVSRKPADTLLTIPELNTTLLFPKEAKCKDLSQTAIVIVQPFNYHLVIAHTVSVHIFVLMHINTVVNNSNISKINVKQIELAIKRRSESRM